MNGNRKRRIRLCSSLERNNKESPRFWMKHTWNIDTVCGFDARGRLVEVVVMILKMALIRLGSDMRPSLFTIAHYCTFHHVWEFRSLRSVHRPPYVVFVVVCLGWVESFRYLAFQNSRSRNTLIILFNNWTAVVGTMINHHPFCSGTLGHHVFEDVTGLCARSCQAHKILDPPKTMQQSNNGSYQMSLNLGGTPCYRRCLAPVSPIDSVKER